jgi:hypothetical protein
LILAADASFYFGEAGDVGDVHKPVQGDNMNSFVRPTQKLVRSAFICAAITVFPVFSALGQTAPSPNPNPMRSGQSADPN